MRGIRILYKHNSKGPQSPAFRRGFRVSVSQIKNGMARGRGPVGCHVGHPDFCRVRRALQGERARGDPPAVAHACGAPGSWLPVPSPVSNRGTTVMRGHSAACALHDRLPAAAHCGAHTRMALDVEIARAAVSVSERFYSARTPRWDRPSDTTCTVAIGRRSTDYSV